jgi:hypothetical protein
MRPSAIKSQTSSLPHPDSVCDAGSVIEELIESVILKFVFPE